VAVMSFTLVGFRRQQLVVDAIVAMDFVGEAFQKRVVLLVRKKERPLHEEEIVHFVTGRKCSFVCPAPHHAPRTRFL
jgi:hypothetical protein